MSNQQASKKPSQLQVFITLLGVFILSPGVAGAAQVSGRVTLNGPARSLTALRVTLRFVGTLPNSTSQEAQRTRPDASGRFIFSDVKAGIYVVQVDGANVLSAQWGALGPELAGTALVVHASDTIHDLSVPVTSRPVLCGRIYGSDGKPAAKATAHAWRTNADGGAMWMGGEFEGASDGGNTTSDHEGHYRFEHFNPGYYILDADSSDSRTGAFWQDTQDLNAALPIDLAANGAPDACTYDLYLKPPPKAYDGPRFQVEGSLAEGADTLAGRRLEWELFSPNRRPTYRDVVAAVPFDLAAPKFAFKNVRPGNYELTLGPPPEGDFSGLCHPLRHMEVDQKIVVSSDVLGVRAELRPVASIQGRIIEVQTRLDVSTDRGYGAQYGVSLLGGSRCTATNALPDTPFTFTDLDPGEYSIRANMPVPGLYTSEVRLNGALASRGTLQLVAGDNSLTITQRFDSGKIDAMIEATTIDGTPARDDRGNWLGGEEHVLLLDASGNRFDANIAARQGKLEEYLPPGRYSAVIGANDEFVWGPFGLWDDPQRLKAMAPLGTSFVVKAGTTTRLTLPDHTVEIQNASAKAGLPMYRVR